MTVEEFDKISLKLRGKVLAQFIDENFEVAEEWMNQLLGEIGNMNFIIDEATSREIWNGILKKIKLYERQREQGYFLSFKTIVSPK